MNLNLNWHSSYERSELKIHAFFERELKLTTQSPNAEGREGGRGMNFFEIQCISQFNVLQLVQLGHCVAAAWPLLSRCLAVAYPLLIRCLAIA